MLSNVNIQHRAGITNLDAVKEGADKHEDSEEAKAHQPLIQAGRPHILYSRSLFGVTI
jgi:hypothetical protein